MIFIYSALFSLIFSCFAFIFIKIYQLENYKLKKYIKNMAKFNFCFGNKTKLKFTKRVCRLIFANFVILFMIFIVFLKKIVIFWQIFTIFMVFFAIFPYFLIISFVIMLPIEKIIKNLFILRARRKLRKCTCKKIGITGSFGKTSTKNILYQILSEEFDVCATPKSFNTPMGVCKTVLENLKETDDFFIVEMGARQSGDIDFLSKFVGIDFGIVTPIGECHLETFGNVENIENTKYELCENTDIVFFNGKSKSTKKLYERYGRKKYLLCDKKGFSYAKNIQSNENGSTFELVINKEELKCNTKLLGKVNIDNIVVAASVAYILGESLVCIKDAIEKVKPSAHRLELIKGYVNVIDDSFNSNFDGFVEALNVLKKFKGRKIVVSPGMVELGKLQDEKNYEIGQKIASVCDFFVIMNETNRKNLSNGAKNGGLSSDKIFYAKTREEQQKILKSIIQKGDVILFENDFPDNIR